MLKNHYAFKMQRSQASSTSPNQKSQSREQNPQSRTSHGHDSNLQEMFAHAVEQLEAKIRTNEELMDEIQENQITIVGAFQAMLSATLMFNTFSENLYKESQSLLLYRSFRSLYEAFSNCSTALHRISSRDGNFNRAKAQYLTEQTRLLSSVSKRDDEAEVDDKIQILVEENKKLREVIIQYENQPKRSSRTGPESDIHTREKLWLKEKIADLEVELTHNNMQFSEKIKMYNEVLSQKEMELKRIKSQTTDSTYSTSNQQLRAQIGRCKQQMQKDQQLIENLTRRVRLLEQTEILKDPVLERSMQLTKSGSRTILAGRKPEGKP